MASYSMFPFTDALITFNDMELGFVKPGLAPVMGFQLTEVELKEIFGIDKARFGPLPKRLVVPELYGQHYTQHWYRVKGFLYQVEPVEWVPVVVSEGTIPKSEFITEYEKKEVEKSETEFNASTSASLTIEGGGSYFGITASVKSESSVSFEVKRSRFTEEQWETKGKTGKVPIHKLFVYPLLRCRVVKQQSINYTVNSSSEELKWGEDNSKFWGDRWVASDRLSQVRRLQYHPVPMEGWAVHDKTYLLPVPKVENGVFSVTTLMSRQGWIDWYVYDAKWEDVDGKTKDFAAPNNGTAFRASYTVVPLEEPSDG